MSTTPAESRTTPWILPAAGMVGTLPFITRRVGDPDYWWHTLTGQLIVHNRALVRTELYTYTVNGTSWTDHEYGSQILFYALTRAGGLLGVAVFFAGVIWASFAFLLLRMRERVVSPFVAAVALVLGAGAGFAVWNPRVQMFDVLFIAIELWWIERFLKAKGRAFYFLPLLVLLWANMHGGFVFAFLVLGVLCVTLAVHWLLERSSSAGRMLRHALLIAAACVVASLITPWGLGLFVYVWKTQFSSQQSSFIAEWQSPDFHMTNVLPFEIMLLLFVVGFIWRRPTLFDVLMTLTGLVLAFSAVRFIVVFVVVALPVLAWQWTPAWVRFTVWLRESGRLTAGVASLRSAGLVALVVIAAGCVGFAGYTLRGQTASTDANYPVAAAGWLASHPACGTRMFNQYDWGGYLANRFYPSVNRRVFIYGEAELMGDQLLAEYVDVNQLHSDWEQVLDEHGVDYVVFAPDRPVDAALQASGLWTLQYSDSVADIFVRDTALAGCGGA